MMAHANAPPVQHKSQMFILSLQPASRTEDYMTASSQCHQPHNKESACCLNTIPYLYKVGLLHYKRNCDTYFLRGIFFGRIVRKYV